MDLCASCGVVRLDRATSCAHCKAAHPSTALTLPRPEDRFWVCLECTFQCRMCGFVVPLNHLDMDGGVSCARCGLEQAFEVRGWVDALRSAHAVGELSGAKAGTVDVDPEIAKVLATRTSITLEVPGANAFRATSSPGHPLCESCHAPVDVAPGTDGRVTVSCKACGASAVYVVPAAARKMTKGALEAVIAVEHRADRAAVKVEQTPGAIAVGCPSCNAPLQASDASKFVTCSYCNTVSRIPDHTWFQMSGKDPVSESMWLLFRGPSQLHEEARRKNEQKAQKAEAAAKRAEARAASEENERARRLSDSEEKRKREQLAEADGEERAAKKEAVGSRLWLGGVGLLVVAVLIGASVWLSKPPSPTTVAPTAASTPVSVAAVRPAAPVKAQPPDVRIPSCKCLARDGSTKNTFGLRAPASGKSLWFFDWSQQTGFMTTNAPFVLPSVDAVLPPPAGTKKLRFAIACDGPIVALVGAQQATAWAADDRAVLWNVTLPSPYALPADPAVLAPTEGSDVDVSCPSLLSVDNGAVALTLASGKHASLAMKDGKVR